MKLLKGYDSMNDRDIYKETLDKWGSESQIDLAIEEMAELMQKLIHFRRGRCDPFDVAEEIADVKLMVEEMAYLFGREHVDAWFDIKKKVVIQRLDDSESEMRASKDILQEFVDDQEDVDAEISEAVDRNFEEMLL